MRAPFLTPTPSTSATDAFTPAPAICPFHDGAETLDLLLAELESDEAELIDAALDLRWLLNTGNDAEACVTQFFRLRSALGERHYLAFYRVRCWVSRRVLVQIRTNAAAPWVTRRIPLGSARIDEVVNTCLAPLAVGGIIPTRADIRFIFAPSSDAAASPSSERTMAELVAASR